MDTHYRNTKPVLDFVLTLTEATGLNDIRDEIIDFLHWEYRIDIPVYEYEYKPTLKAIREVLKEIGAESIHLKNGAKFTHKVTSSKFQTLITCVNHETGDKEDWSTRKDIDTCPYCNTTLGGIGPDGD